MKLNIIIAAVTAFAAATLVQAETPALRGVKEPSADVAKRALKGTPCGTIICRDPRDPPYIVSDPVSQARSADAVEPAAQPAANVETASGSPCNFWNNWCRGRPPQVVNDPAPQAPSADPIKPAVEAAANVETAARKGTPCGTIICRDPRDPPYVVNDPAPQAQSADAIDAAHL